MWRVSTTTSNPHRVGEYTVTVQTTEITGSGPFWGAFWKRPTAVLVERDGQTETHPVVNVTRMAQLGILMLCVSIILPLKLYQQWLRSNKKTGEEE